MLKKTIIVSCLALCSFGILGSSVHAAEKQALSPRNASIVTMAAFTAQGDLENRRPAINQALNSGMTVNETKEVMLHLYAYCGFPRCFKRLEHSDKRFRRTLGYRYHRYCRPRAYSR